METGRDLQSFELCQVPPPVVPTVERAPRDEASHALSAELSPELLYLPSMLTTFPLFQA